MNGVCVLAQRNLHGSSRLGDRLSRCVHVQCLMRALGVVEADPVAYGARSVLDAVEALAVDALLLDGADDALDHSVLLGAMRSDELLLQAVAAYQGCVFVAGDDELVVGPEQEFPRHFAQCAKPVDQGVLQGTGRGCRFAGARQMPS